MATAMSGGCGDEHDGSWRLTLELADGVSGGGVCCSTAGPPAIDVTVSGGAFKSLYGDGLLVEGTFDGSRVSGTVELGQGACTASPADAVSFTLDCINSTQCRGSWIAPDAVYPENSPPVAHDGSRWTPAQNPLTWELLQWGTDINGDAVSLTAVTQPAMGTVTNNGDGTVTYMASSVFDGMDPFQFTVTDERGLSATGTFTINVYADQPWGSGNSLPPNDIPEACEISNLFEGVALFEQVASGGGGGGGGGCTPTGCPSEAPWDCGDGCYVEPPSGPHNCRKCP